MINKLLNMFDKFNIKRATELVKKEVFQPSKDLVYDVETIILPDYRHVKTPLQVEEFLRRMTGLPSFNSFNEVQKKKYLYWKKEVLSCNYIDTEANYIFAFVYELLNYTFNDNAAFNLSMLDRLYVNYHEKHSTLAHYLPQWIGDFCYELGDYGLEKTWSDKMRNYENADYEYLKRLENKLETVSITFWKRFIKYNKTKFFRTKRSLIYKVFKASVSILETNYRDQGQNLIDEWMPKNEKISFKRQLFINALIARKTPGKQEVSRRPSFKMREDLTALFRLAENIARVNVGEKRQLSVDESCFPEGFKESLVVLFPNQSAPSLFSEGRFVKTRDKGVMGLGSAVPNPAETFEPDVPRGPIIEFDFDRIDTLDKESKELLEIFALRYDDDDEEPLKILNEVLERSQDSPEQLSSDEEVESFVAMLNELECEFICGFKDLTRATQEGMQTLKTHGIMMGVFLNALNEKSLEYLGDNLVEQDGDVLNFNEDFEQVFLRLAEED